MAPVECVDLMDSSGRVMNLEEKQQSAALTSSVLAERQHYVLLRVCRESVKVSKPHLVHNLWPEQFDSRVGNIWKKVNNTLQDK